MIGTPSKWILLNFAADGRNRNPTFDGRRRLAQVVLRFNYIDSVKQLWACKAPGWRRPHQSLSYLLASLRERLSSVLSKPSGLFIEWTVTEGGTTVRPKRRQRKESETKQNRRVQSGAVNSGKSSEAKKRKYLGTAPPTAWHISYHITVLTNVNKPPTEMCLSKK